MHRRNEPSLTGLVRRLTFSGFLALAGTWGLVLTRLEQPAVKDFLSGQSSFNLASLSLPLIDLFSLSLALLGLLMTLYYRLRLIPRLRRIAELNLDHFC